MFALLNMSVRKYAVSQGRDPGLLSRYLNGHVLPSEEFCRDLVAEVGRLVPAAAADEERLLATHRAAGDASPGSWGGSSRDRQQLATARAQAEQAQRDLRQLVGELAQARERILHLERQRGDVRGRPVTHGPRWDFYRNHLGSRVPHAFVESVDQATDEIVQRMADPRSSSPFHGSGRVFVPIQAGGKSLYVGATLAKALDLGFRFVITMTDPLNAVRSQMQARLDEGLPRATSLWLTGPHSDYRSIIGSFPALLAFEKQQPDRPLHDPQNLERALARLVVVKRSVPVMRKLMKDVQAHAGRLEEVPVLILDAVDGPLMPGGALDRAVTDLKAAFPRLQYLSFATVDPAERETPEDFTMWLQTAPR
ncbi:hypothetical protein JIG36_41495 [Actinoplanes sp. LDG1-06]|uniref:Uncharacterized protein n=1 Tax=Paractinoplanes ovalisporus TaxID=2810368 RepID=A0ABS2AQ59_9ACTN|nr:hypothetical protein [Actinoplanes ovalisporus]MBM2621997.1 hypothetical protein [Actinoplanes ovalisporus]